MLTPSEKNYQAILLLAMMSVLRESRRYLLPNEVSPGLIYKILQRAWNLPNPLALPGFLSRAHTANVASAASQMLYQEAESTLPVEEKSRRRQLRSSTQSLLGMFQATSQTLLTCDEQLGKFFLDSGYIIRTKPHFLCRGWHLSQDVSAAR